MVNEGYVEALGYGDVTRHVFEIVSIEDGDEDEIPEACHILAEWPNGAFTAHFNVPNTVLDFFNALDQAGDPSLVSKVWCCDSEDESYLDTDDLPNIEWPPL
jgi:hypothetical protein